MHRESMQCFSDSLTGCSGSPDGLDSLSRSFMRATHLLVLEIHSCAVSSKNSSGIYSIGIKLSDKKVITLLRFT